MERLDWFQFDQQLVAQEWTDDDVDAAIIQDRNAEIRQIETDVICLNEIFRDLAMLVSDQGEQIDVAAKNTEEAVVATEEGVQNLEKAEAHSIAARRRGWLLKGALAFSGITVGGIGLAIISPIAGILTAGAGITGIVTTIGIALKKNN